MNLRCGGADCAQVGQAWLKVEVDKRPRLDFRAWPMVSVAVAGACGNIHTVVLSEDKQSLVCTESDAGGTVGTGGREGTSDDQYRATRSRITRDKKIMYYRVV